MTEVGSKSATAGPVIGGGAASNDDIVKGLDGLRLLIERHQTNERRGEAAPGIKVRSDTRARAMRTESATKTVDLNITNDNTILAITGKSPEVYVIEGDGLRLYNSDSVNGQPDRINAAVNRLDASKFIIRRNRAVAGQRMLVSKAMADELAIVDDGVVYHDYLLRLNKSATEAVKTMLAQRPKKTKLLPPRGDNLSKKKSGNSAPENDSTSRTGRADNSSDATTLLNKVVRIKRIVDRTSKGEVSPRDAMELFLTVGQASRKILNELLDLADGRADSIIDNLRRTGGIGEETSDGTYPILIDGADDLRDGDDAEGTLVSFRHAVHKEEVARSELVYDLDEVSLIEWADELVRCTADYMRTSRNPRVRQMLVGEGKHVELSSVLRVASGDGGRPDYNDMSLFENNVMTAMIMCDAVSINPTDGYPWVVWQVAATDNLKADSLRYLANNKEWISAVLSVDQLESLTRQIANIDFDKATDTRRNLQKVVSLQYAALVDAMRIEGDVADGQQQITIK